MLDVSLQKMSISTKSHGKKNSRILNFFLRSLRHVRHRKEQSLPKRWKETEKNAKNADFDMAGDSPQKTNKHQVSTTAYEEFNRRTYLKF